MKKLIARLPILYLGHQYVVGEEVPANNPEMVECWLKTRAVVWEGDDQENTAPIPKKSPTKPTAKQTVKRPGRTKKNEDI